MAAIPAFHVVTRFAAGIFAHTDSRATHIARRVRDPHAADIGRVFLPNGKRPEPTRIPHGNRNPSVCQITGWNSLDSLNNPSDSATQILPSRYARPLRFGPSPGSRSSQSIKRGFCNVRCAAISRLSAVRLGSPGRRLCRDFGPGSNVGGRAASSFDGRRRHRCLDIRRIPGVPLGLAGWLNSGLCMGRRPLGNLDRWWALLAVDRSSC